MDKKEKKAAKAAAKAEKKANKTSDPEMKNTVIKSVCAVVCVVALCLSANSGVTKIADAKIKAAETVAAATADGGEGTGEFTDNGMDASADVPTDAPVAGDDTTAPVAGDDAAAADTDATAAADNGGSATAKAPTTADEIVKLYNAATAKAAAKAVGFDKERNTTEKEYSAGVALKASKSIVYKFMGVGADNKFSKAASEMNKDNYQKYLQASKLTTADITGATCTEAGGKYTITINVKNGSSSVKDGKVVSSNNSPLDRSGLACGDNDKDYWDHKTAENVMSAIDEVPGCSGANIDESYSNAKIVAVIDSATGNLVSLTASYDFTFNLDKVMGSNGKAVATSIVTMKNFKW